MKLEFKPLVDLDFIVKRFQRQHPRRDNVSLHDSIHTMYICNQFAFLWKYSISIVSTPGIYTRPCQRGMTLWQANL